MSAMCQRRDHRGRFSKGNRHGVATRFQRGTSGNSRGRPPTFDTCLKALSKRNLGPAELKSILLEPRARLMERSTAAWSLIRLSRGHPVANADPAKARCFYRRWYRKPYGKLVMIFTSDNETPERREAARRRLCRWAIE